MITGETQNLNGGKMDEPGATTVGASRASLRLTVLTVAIPVVAAIIGYVTLPSHKPLLDEQFLSALAKGATHGNASAFFSWSGFETYDHWGPVAHGTLAVVGGFIAKQTALFRIIEVIMHCLTTGCVYAIVRGLRLNRIVALSTATLFALYPLSVEAVAWSGGFGAQLGCMFTMISLALYTKMRQNGLKWALLGGSLFSYALAMGSSTNYWFVPLMVLWLELSALPFRKDETVKRDFTQFVLPSLMFSMVAAVFIAASGIDSISLPELKIGLLGTLVRDLALPINQITWSHYSKEYRLGFMLMGLLAPALAVGLWRSREARFGLLVAVGWLALSSLPFCGIVLTEPGFYGQRWLYLAALPVSLIVGIACSAMSASNFKHPRALQVVSIVLTLLLSGTYFRHLWNSNSTYRNGGRKLASIAKSIQIANAKLNRPYLLLRDLPSKLSLAPSFRSAEPACYDTNTGLLRSNAVPDGRLKDLLRDGKMADITLRWEENLASFIPVELTPTKATWLENMKPIDISYRLSPGLAFYKTVSMDEAEQCLVLETNSENGPMITLTSCELSPVDGDYLYVDARIECPQTVVAPSIELHWQTNLHQNYERKERFCYTKATVNDKQYHRYYLSLRRSGWTTGGSPQFIALGFPSGAKVWLKTIGLQRGTENIAKLKVPETGNVGAAQASPTFSPPFINYPNDTDLGLVALAPNADALKASYSVENLDGASGVSVEVSQPNKNFDDANSDHLSSVTWKTFPFTGRSGELSIPLSELNGPGIYNVRVIGTAAGGGFVGMFSDAVSFQVPSHKE
ncbi:MAG: hypothetical protein K2W95_22750 [Candidatus Obscuribacterales bacterium]|nr:hypothetical protein [Candidatus Obscuribacterales bacterium]